MRELLAVVAGCVMLLLIGLSCLGTLVRYDVCREAGHGVVACALAAGR